MNWEYLIIAGAIAASLAYLIRRSVLRKRTHGACGASSANCACCPQASAKAHGVRNDD